jgi:hypothetical protein
VIEVTAALSNREGTRVVGPELYIPQYFGSGAGFAIARRSRPVKTNAPSRPFAPMARTRDQRQYFKIDVYGDDRLGHSRLVA